MDMRFNPYYCFEYATGFAVENLWVPNVDIIGRMNSLCNETLFFVPRIFTFLSQTKQENFKWITAPIAIESASPASQQLSTQQRRVQLFVTPYLQFQYFHDLFLLIDLLRNATITRSWPRHSRPPLLPYATQPEEGLTDCLPTHNEHTLKISNYCWPGCWSSLLVSCCCCLWWSYWSGLLIGLPALYAPRGAMIP